MALITFTPKAGGEDWTADLDEEIHRHNGFDVILFLDKKADTEDSGWMLELAVEADGSINGQITAHPGEDALAVFTCTQDTLKVFSDSTTPACIISDAPDAPQRSAARDLAECIEALRSIYSGSSIEGRWLDDDGEAGSHDEAAPGDGLYDRDNPPDGYNAKGWCGAGVAPAEPLRPAYWELYTRGEQDGWVASCAATAKAVLEKIGVPLEAPGGEG